MWKTVLPLLPVTVARKTAGWELHALDIVHLTPQERRQTGCYSLQAETIGEEELGWLGTTLVACSE